MFSLKNPRWNGISKSDQNSDVKPKFEAGIQIKLKPIEDFNRGMEIFTDLNVPTNKGKIKTEKIDVLMQYSIVLYLIMKLVQCP